VRIDVDDDHPPTVDANISVVWSGRERIKDSGRIARRFVLPAWAERLLIVRGDGKEAETSSRKGDGVVERRAIRMRA
jgi:hypothetical protein